MLQNQLLVNDLYDSSTNLLYRREAAAVAPPMACYTTDVCERVKNLYARGGYTSLPNGIRFSTQMAASVAREGARKGSSFSFGRKDVSPGGFGCEGGNVYLHKTRQRYGRICVILGGENRSSPFLVLTACSYGETNTDRIAKTNTDRKPPFMGWRTRIGFGRTRIEAFRTRIDHFSNTDRFVRTRIKLGGEYSSGNR